MFILCLINSSNTSIPLMSCKNKSNKTISGFNFIIVFIAYLPFEFIQVTCNLGI